MTKKKIFSTKSERNDFLIALIVIVVFAILIFKVLSMGDTSENSMIDDAMVHGLDTDQKIETAITQDALESNGSIASNEYGESRNNSFISDESVEGSSEESVSDTPLLVDYLEIKDTVNVIEVPVAVEEDTLVKFKDQKSQKTDDITMQGVDSIAQDSKLALESENAGVDAIVNTVSTMVDCTLIIGVYKEALNADKTALKLKKNGYRVHIGKMTQGRHYAGVPVHCDDKNEIKRVQQSLADDLGMKSWIRKN